MQKNISNFVLIFFIAIFMFNPLQGMKIEENASEGGNCSICIESYNNVKEPVITLMCQHSFHSACFEKWISQNSCPLCREKVLSSEKSIIVFDKDEHTDIVTPYGTYIWQPNVENKIELPKVHRSIAITNYLSSCITVLKKPSTYKPLLIPALSLSLPWVLLDRSTSRDGLILKGLMATGIYCLLTPFGISPTFRWFSGERAKRIIGATLIFGSCTCYKSGLPVSHEDGLGSSMFANLIVSVGGESIIALIDRAYDMGLDNSKGIDLWGSTIMAGVVSGALISKFFKLRST